MKARKGDPYGKAAEIKANIVERNGRSSATTLQGGHEPHTEKVSAQPHFRQTAAVIQSYGTVSHLPPVGLEEPVRLASLTRLTSEALSLERLPEEFSRASGASMK
jgi:hypothetical protein